MTGGRWQVAGGRWQVAGGASEQQHLGPGVVAHGGDGVQGLHTQGLVAGYGVIPSLPSPHLGIIGYMQVERTVKK